jgi:uncharacterized protein
VTARIAPWGSRRPERALEESVVRQEERDVVISDNRDRSRYEIRLDGALAGFAEYERDTGRIVFTHTEIDPAFEGQGVGSTLARAVLDEARAAGLAVVPRCPFIRAYIDRHAEYQDLVDGRHAGG